MVLDFRGISGLVKFTEFSVSLDCWVLVVLEAAMKKIVAI